MFFDHVFLAFYFDRFNFWDHNPVNPKYDSNDQFDLAVLYFNDNNSLHLFFITGTLLLPSGTRKDVTAHLSVIIYYQRDFDVKSATKCPLCTNQPCLKEYAGRIVILLEVFSTKNGFN